MSYFTPQELEVIRAAQAEEIRLGIRFGKRQYSGGRGNQLTEEIVGEIDRLAEEGAPVRTISQQTGIRRATIQRRLGTLTDEQIQRIRDMGKRGLSTRQIAAAIPCSQSAVQRLLVRERQEGASL